MMDTKCPVGGAIFLIVGILFLLKDIGTWTFFGLNWWTLLFILIGLGMLMHKKK